MRRKISILLAVLLVISSVNTMPALAMQNEQENMGIPESGEAGQKVPQKRKFSKKQKKKLKEIEFASESSGLETAEILEEIEEDEELYEYSLKNIILNQRPMENSWRISKRTLSAMWQKKLLRIMKRHWKNAARQMNWIITQKILLLYLSRKQMSLI